MIKPLIEDSLDIDNIMPNLLENEQVFDNTPTKISPRKTDLIREFNFKEEILGQGEKVGTGLNQELSSAKGSSFIGIGV
jgi:hypothetical protein